MSSLDRAILLSAKIHQGQMDRYGAWYILHPIRVMQKVYSEDEKIIAILHDVIEDSDCTLELDSDCTLELLRKEGFSEEIITAIDCLTKRKDEDYMSYIARSIDNTLARKVKLADLEDNMDMKRVMELNEDDTKRMNRYLEAWKYLRLFDQKTGE
jgi:(p)ppGpp synthase/HD superfamily hydrolase